MPVRMEKLSISSCVAIVALLLYIFGSVASYKEPPIAHIWGENHKLVDLSSGRSTSVGGEGLLLLERSASTEATSMASESFVRGRSHEDGLAYQEAVEAFVGSYRDTISATNPLVHKLLMHSEGAQQMTKAEAQKLGCLLSDMDRTVDFEAVGSYPEGYEDCADYLKVGVISLELAADSIRGFNRTADMEYLRDYRRLITMYMRAVADAQSCVANRLYSTYP